MIIKPKFKDFICVTAHPEGCEANVSEQVSYVKAKSKISGCKKVLVIGASTGYGLATRVVSTFGAGASTLGIVFERPASGKKTASAGWYNTAAFEKMAKQEGYYSKTINGDAFSKEVKNKTIEIIKKDFGKVDLVVYSIASPRRNDPITGETFYSALKPVGEVYKNKAVDFHTYKVSDIEIEPATETEINGTIKVMGGEDWQLWIDALMEAGVLEEGATTVAYSYIGPKITYPIYRNGTIGKAKEHLENTALSLNKKLQSIKGRAYVTVNKGLVTQSSSAIPVVPLYISLLDKVMKEKGINEGCIEQIYRLFSQQIFGTQFKLDELGRIRIDNLEMREDVQKEITDLWGSITSQNITQVTNIEQFRKDFFKLFGFGVEGIDYDKEVQPKVEIPNLQ